MADPVDRRAVLHIIGNAFDDSADFTSADYVRIRRQVEALSERKKGTWRHYEGTLTCSVCGAEFDDDIMDYLGGDVPRFCPDCGADLRGEQNDT